MQNYNTLRRFSPVCLFVLLLVSCNNKDAPIDGNIVADPGELDNKIAENIAVVRQKALRDSGKIDDSTRLELKGVVNKFYSTNGDQPVWSHAGKWQPLADSLYQFITRAEREGLFPEDYHAQELTSLRDSLNADSITRMNAGLWTRAEILLTDGFLHILKDLKQGRLQPDSMSMNKDLVLGDKFFFASLNTLLEKKDLTGLFRSVQPGHNAYWELKKSIPKFVDNMDRRTYTHVTYPFKRGDRNDSLYFVRQLQKRLLEAACIDALKGLPDSAQLTHAVKKYQVKYRLKVDGLYGRDVVGSMNANDVEKFKQIAITLDKYKHLPEKMPSKYIWVNLPGNYLVLMDSDTVVLESKVIIGRPETRTPLLTSEISDIITYPTWTVPNSIIVKQYLPKLKRNPNYISRIGLKLLNSMGEVVDPNSVNWSKYSRGIPYRVMQSSGDNNSLGVMKFNFSNKYSVYLHDTNQRYLFKNADRALSHGCIRVQEWDKLAFYIADNDSIMSKRKDSLKYTADSIRNWIAKKEMHRIDVKNHIPLYIRYFTCEGKNGEIKFYNDIYGEDKQLLEKYFTKK